MLNDSRFFIITHKTGIDKVRMLHRVEIFASYQY